MRNVPLLVIPIVVYNLVAPFGMDLSTRVCGFFRPRISSPPWRSSSSASNFGAVLFRRREN